MRWGGAHSRDMRRQNPRSLGAAAVSGSCVRRKCHVGWALSDWSDCSIRGAALLESTGLMDVQSRDSHCAS